MIPRASPIEGSARGRLQPDFDLSTVCTQRHTESVVITVKELIRNLPGNDACISNVVRDGVVRFHLAIDIDHTGRATIPRNAVAIIAGLGRRNLTVTADRHGAEEACGAGNAGLTGGRRAALTKARNRAFIDLQEELCRARIATSPAVR